MIIALDAFLRRNHKNNNSSQLPNISNILENPKHSGKLI